MERIRKPFQGVTNIIRFNWPFYSLSIVLIISLLTLLIYLSASYKIYILAGTCLVLVGTLNSLLVSFYVYDLSALYTLSWLDRSMAGTPQELVTINAGFDETSALIQQKFPTAMLHVLDFYDPALHTEVSIKRAREAYPTYPGTLTITTTYVPLPDQSIDAVFLVLAAHEIRNADERTQFFIELRRILKPNGKLIVVEHLRNTVNFAAYSIGFMHFLSKTAWLSTFKQARLNLARQATITPFLTVFTLEKHAATS